MISNIVHHLPAQGVLIRCNACVTEIQLGVLTTLESMNTAWQNHLNTAHPFASEEGAE